MPKRGTRKARRPAPPVEYANPALVRIVQDHCVVVVPDELRDHDLLALEISTFNLASAGYWKGDTVLVDFSTPPERAALATVVTVREEVLTGRYHKTPKGARLVTPDGPTYRLRSEDVTAAGVVVGHARIVDGYGLEWPTVIEEKGGAK